MSLTLINPYLIYAMLQVAKNVILYTNIIHLWLINICSFIQILTLKAANNFERLGIFCFVNEYIYRYILSFHFYTVIYDFLKL